MEKGRSDNVKTCKPAETSLENRLRRTNQKKGRNNMKLDDERAPRTPPYELLNLALRIRNLFIAKKRELRNGRW